LISSGKLAKDSIQYKHICSLLKNDKNSILFLNGESSSQADQRKTLDYNSKSNSSSASISKINQTPEIQIQTKQKFEISSYFSGENVLNNIPTFLIDWTYDGFLMNLLLKKKYTDVMYNFGNCNKKEVI